MPHNIQNNIAFAAIKTELQQYCRELSNNLDTCSGLAAKYLAVPPVSYDPYKNIVDSEKRREFLRVDSNTNQSPFDVFFQRLLNVIDKMQLTDVNSIRQGNDTPFAKEFGECVELLNSAGLYNVNGKPINFWSGPEAQKMANTVSTSLSDSNVPAISILSKLGTLLKADHRKLSNTLFNAASAEFTGQATGGVIVYSSASNANETEPLINVGNFHWNVELPLLQKLKHRGLVEKIEFSHFLHKKKVSLHDIAWLQSVDLNDTDLLPFIPPISNSSTLTYLDSKPLPIEKNYRNSLSLPVDISYQNSPPLSVNMIYVNSAPLPIELSYVNSTPLAIDTSYVDSKPLSDFSSTMLDEEEGMWLKPVEFNKLRLVLRRLSTQGSETEKGEQRQKWVNEGPQRPWIEVEVLKKYFDRWKEKTLSKLFSVGKSGLFCKKTDNSLNDVEKEQKTLGT